MNFKLSIPERLEEMKVGDVEPIVTRALTEAHGEKTFNLLDFGYPVPMYMNSGDARKVVTALLPQTMRASL